MDYNKDMTIQDRFCLALRQVTADWRNAPDNRGSWKTSNKTKDLKKKT